MTGEKTRDPNEYTAEEVYSRLRAMGENMTEEDVRERKISFILGTVSRNSGIRRKDVENYLDRHKRGRAAA